MMTTNQAPQPWRRYRCGNGHTWRAAVVRSDHTPRISGERWPSCPECGRDAGMGEPWTTEDGSPYPFELLRKE